MWINGYFRLALWVPCLSVTQLVVHVCLYVKVEKNIVPLYKAVSYELSQRFFDFF